MATCGSCHGTGTVTCSFCGGRGSTSRLTAGGDMDISTCGVCGGRRSTLCMTCTGSGQAPGPGVSVSGLAAFGQGAQAADGGKVIRLRRARRGRWVAGVVAGLAKRMGISPTLARVLYVAISALSAAFPGIIVYLILWVALPQEEEQDDDERAR